MSAMGSCKFLGGISADRTCRCRGRSVTALYRAIQPQEAIGTPLRHPDVSLRGGAADVAISQYHVG